MDDPLLLTVVEAGRRLGLRRSKTYELILSGELPSVKIGGARRVLVSDLHEFVERLRNETEDDHD